MVLLEVQRHPKLEHLEVVVITPNHRLKLGPSNPPRLLRAVLEQVHWVSLEDLSQQPDLDPLFNLLTLPVRPESELAASSQQILARRLIWIRLCCLCLCNGFPSSPWLFHPQR